MGSMGSFGDELCSAAGTCTPVTSHIARNSPPSFWTSSAGGPASSSRPSRMTRMMSESAMVWSRCAMQNIVHLNSVRSMACSFLSVSGSVEDVGSSRSKTLGHWITARARQSNCRSPHERFAPPAFNSLSRTVPTSSLLAIDAQRRPRRKDSSSTAPKGSRFMRTVPCMRTGSCGTTVMRRRMCRRPTVLRSTPSMRTRPLATSWRRNKHATSVLLPLPVRPMTPVRAPAGMEKLTSVNASGKVLR
mmetsp:Transcript_39536/g.123136  ORF Transcript_39536/g.123136 Transcript_39536/m.123136 type:complete len:246 (-) Transcript_39536:54-791(-)